MNWIKSHHIHSPTWKRGWKVGFWQWCGRERHKGGTELNVLRELKRNGIRCGELSSPLQMAKRDNMGKREVNFSLDGFGNDFQTTRTWKDNEFKSEQKMVYCKWLKVISFVEEKEIRGILVPEHVDRDTLWDVTLIKLYMKMNWYAYVNSPYKQKLWFISYHASYC